MEDFYIDLEIFKYPESFNKLVELKLLDFDIWFVMEKKQATGIYNGMRERYPNRQLIPFAKRADNDDTACFEIGKGNKIQIIHDFASAGYEQRGEFDDLWEWVRSAVETMIDFNRDDEKWKDHQI